jgi:hypothetical protein
LLEAVPDLIRAARENQKLSKLCDDALSLILEHHSSEVMRDEHEKCVKCSKMPYSLQLAWLFAHRNARNNEALAQTGGVA